MNQQSWDPQLYADKHAFVWQLATPLLELLSPQHGERILDLGCGTGELTAQIAEAGAEVVGMDHSPEMIIAAQRDLPGIQFVRGDARDFSVAEPFDAVFSNACLHWITEPQAVLRSVACALRSGGRFVVEFGGAGNVVRMVGGIQAAYKELTGRRLEHPWYFPNIPQYTSLLQQAGMETLQAAMVDRPTPLLDPGGYADWVRMFGGHWIQQLAETDRERFPDLAASCLREQAGDAEPAVVDYRRIRVVARRG